MITPMPPPGSNGSLDLKMKSEVENNFYNQVTSNTNADLSQGFRHSNNTSEITANDMFIVRETGYDVQHKKVPMLRMTSYYENESN